MISKILLENLIKDSKIIHFTYKDKSDLGTILGVDVIEYKDGLHGTITIAIQSEGVKDHKITTDIANIRILRIY